MTSDTLVSRIKQNEGSIAYQKKIGTYVNGKFKLYKDTLGFWTIGYGHMCSRQEEQKYKDGMSETLASLVLIQDLMAADQGARRLFEMNRHPVEVQDVLIEMVFQLGERKASGFKRFKAAVDALDYHNAAHELEDSNWYKQTTSRVQAHIAVLLALV